MYITNYHDYIKKMLDETPERHERIARRASELMKEVEPTIMKTNASYVNTKPTREDVDVFIKWIDNHEALSGSYESEMKLKVERLWQEIEDLRSILEKQIY